MKKDIISLEYCLKNFPLRISITDFCNLKCFFCSNEGMSLKQKNLTHVDIYYFKKIISFLHSRGLKKLSITGGDPTLNPDIKEIITFLNGLKFDELFFHTNGINLDKDLLTKLSSNFNKIAISIHSVNFDTWHVLTGGSKFQFDKLINNIKTAAKFNRITQIEIKYVPIKGINDTKKEIVDFLNMCDKFKFKFKFLNFEPIKKSDIGLDMSIEELKKKLIDIGCVLVKREENFRGQKNYLPIEIFSYKRTLGVAIEIGCGLSEACHYCYKSNEKMTTKKQLVKLLWIPDYS